MILLGEGSKGDDYLSDSTIRAWFCWERAAGVTIASSLYTWLSLTTRSHYSNIPLQTKHLIYLIIVCMLHRSLGHRFNESCKLLHNWSDDKLGLCQWNTVVCHTHAAAYVKIIIHNFLLNFYITTKSISHIPTIWLSFHASRIGIKGLSGVPELPFIKIYWTMECSVRLKHTVWKPKQ